MNQSSFRNSDRVTPNRPAEGRKFSSNFAVSRKRCSTKLLLLLDIDRKTYVVYGTTWSVMTLSVLGMVMSATANLWMVNAVKYSACVVYYCERRYMVFLRPFFKLACLVHKVLNTGHPPYLTELLQYHKPARSTPVTYFLFRDTTFHLVRALSASLRPKYGTYGAVELPPLTQTKNTSHKSQKPELCCVVNWGESCVVPPPLHNTPPN